MRSIVMWFIALLPVIIAVGCCGPAYHCGRIECPPQYCQPQPIYGEPMHPVLRRDGGTILVPHGQFKQWVRDSPAPTVEATE